MIASALLAAALVAAPPSEWGSMLERTAAATPAPEPGPPPAPPSPDPDVTPGPFRSPAPRPTTRVYRLVDASGQAWEDADRENLIRWVASRNASSAYRFYRLAPSSCATGNCPR